MFCALAGCTSPVARHRLHVTSADPLPRSRPSPAGRLLVSGPAGRHRRCRHRLHVTSADPLPRWPSPLAGCSSADPLAVTAGRLLVTGCTSVHPLAGCSSRLNVTGCPAGRHPLQCHRFYLRSSADPLHVSGPAGRLLVTDVTRWPSRGPVARHGPAGRLLVTFERHRLHVTSADPLPRWPSPVARHPLAGCSSADPLAVTAGRLLVTGCTSRQRTRCPAGRHRLHVTLAGWPVARHRLHVTGCTSRQRTRCPAGRHRWPVAHVSGPAGRHRWPVARHRLHVTSADPLPRWPSPAGRLLVTFERHRLHVTSADPLAVTGCTSRQRTR